jgi:hypothetical protein
MLCAHLGNKNVLLNFKINSMHCTKLLGITNTNIFKQIAELHVPKMKFVFFVEPNHQGTCALEINNPSLKDPIFAEFSHAIECLAGASTYIMSDIVFYLLEKSIRIDFATVKKIMGK